MNFEQAKNFIDKLFELANELPPLITPHIANVLTLLPPTRPPILELL